LYLRRPARAVARVSSRRRVEHERGRNVVGDAHRAQCFVTLPVIDEVAQHGILFGIGEIHRDELLRARDVALGEGQIAFGAAQHITRRDSGRNQDCDLPSTHFKPPG
jgi:hypothetical protein